MFFLSTYVANSYRYCHWLHFITMKEKGLLVSDQISAAARGRDDA
jgi:hypothetical protein